MTGYGSGQATSKKMEVLCEIKSVNNRFIDISFKGYSLPNDLEAVSYTHLTLPTTPYV